jgi:hypothetical protein
MFSERLRGAAERLAGTREPPAYQKRTGGGVQSTAEGKGAARGPGKAKRSGQEHGWMERSGRGPEHQRGRKND